MRDRGRVMWIWAGIAAAALSAALWVLIAGGDGSGTETAGEPAADEATAPAPARVPPTTGGRSSEDRDRGDAGGGSGGEPVGSGLSRPDPEDFAERRALRGARRAYRRYVRAINDRDGAAICAMIAAGFVGELRPPAKGAGCAERIRRSIGFRDERGFPVWEETTLTGFESALVGDGGGVQLSAAIVTEFRDREQPSVETDIAYLEPDGERGFRLAKASAALYRAVGKPDVPPQAISPPPGF